MYKFVDIILMSFEYIVEFYPNSLQYAYVFLHLFSTSEKLTFSTIMLIDFSYKSQYNLGLLLTVLNQ